MASWSRPGSFPAKANEAERTRLSYACRVKPPCSRKKVREKDGRESERTSIRVGHDS
jgi:hypothetical protein